MYTLFYFKKVGRAWYLVNPKLINAPKTLKGLFPDVYYHVVCHKHHDFKLFIPTTVNPIMIHCFDICDSLCEDLNGLLCVKVCDYLKDYESL